MIVAVAELPIIDAKEFMAIATKFEDEPTITLTRVRSLSDEQELTIRLEEKNARGPNTDPSINKTQPSLLTYKTVQVYYATNRNNTGSDDPNTTFGPDRGELVQGICIVTIPKVHEEGVIEAPSLWRLQFNENPAKHITLAALKKMAVDEFYGDVRSTIARDGNRSAFVFVHGYNVKFKDAAKRTAQMAHDLKFAGAPSSSAGPPAAGI